MLHSPEEQLLAASKRHNAGQRPSEVLREADRGCQETPNLNPQPVLESNKDAPDGRVQGIIHNIAAKITSKSVRVT